MKSLEKKEILRLNCPGYGEGAILAVSSAKPLDHYKVIIANPVSFLHLFADEVQTLEQIEAAQLQGLTSLLLSDDHQLKVLADVAAIRTDEIVRFLEKGGLLIYYLCRPFILHDANVSLDNYIWLLSLAPDQPGDKNMRHMSSVSQGRDIEVCEKASGSEFSQYFAQSDLQWSTIIRSEFLTEGYNTLALAGPKKCIAGELYAGDNGGRIVFLPAPYSPEFDDTLMECVKLWYQGKQGDDEIGQVESAVDSSTDQENTSENVALIRVDLSTKHDEISPPPALNGSQTTEANQETKTAMETPEQKAARFLKERALKSTTELGVAFVDVSKQLEQEAKEQGISQGIGSAAHSLVKALEKSAISSTPNTRTEEQYNGSQEISSWCRLYTLPGLDSLYKEKDVLIAQIEKEQTRVNSIQEGLAKVEDLKNYLLGSSGDNLKEACMRALKRLGWNISQSTMHKEEIWLAINAQPEAIVRVVASDSSPNRADLAQLAESIIMFWEHHEQEPKGILIACTWRATPLVDRKEPDFSETLIEFAKKKNIGLITTHQLLCRYRDIELGKVSADQIRQEFLTANGALSESGVLL
jgi:hypothetical protein